MAGSLFYNLGRRMGPRVRKVRWMWESLTGSEADAIRLEHGVGLDLAHEAGQQLRIDPDPRMREVLGEIGYRLSTQVANRLRSFRFEAFLGGGPNAFALPGGFIFVGRSIVELCQWNRDEIAFVLGHEMAHVIRGHAIERIVTNSAVSAASRTRLVPGVLGAWLRNVGVHFLETAYSRDQELEADRLGMRLAAAAGYEPEAAVQLLTRLGEVNKTAEPGSLGEYFSTHPSPEARINSLHDYLRQRPPQGERKGP
jgi:predicted Zn-dependent protease